MDTQFDSDTGCSEGPGSRSVLARGWIAAAVALALAACTTVAAPNGTATKPAATASLSASIAPSMAPTMIPTPKSPEPIPWEGVHVAAGLALVRFVDNGGPASEVFVVDAEGEFHQLTGLGSAASLGASLPVWSPDGRQVAFGPPKVGAGTDRFLSVIMADGSGERPVARLGDEFGLPFGWSPDGASLLFFDIDAVDGPAMWLADVASGEVTHLGAGQLPRWLPDGRRISFQRGIEGRDPADPRALTEVIYVMSLEDGDVAEFADASDAIWSPDGSAVVLQHSTGVLLLADADGSNARDLVRGWAPVWSPDGSQIVFAYDHTRDGVPMLAAVDLSGRVLWSGVGGSSPTWSPDGSRIAVEVLFPDLSVKVLNAETGDVLWETAGAEPAWGP